MTVVIFPVVDFSVVIFPKGAVKLVVALRVSTFAPSVTSSPPSTTVFPAPPVPVEVSLICLASTDVTSLVVMLVVLLFTLRDLDVVLIVTWLSPEVEPGVINGDFIPTDVLQ